MPERRSRDARRDAELVVGEAIEGREAVESARLPQLHATRHHGGRVLLGDEDVPGDDRGDEQRERGVVEEVDVVDREDRSAGGTGCGQHVAGGVEQRGAIVGPEGEVLLARAWMPEAAVIGGDDDGKTWSEPQVIATVIPNADGTYPRKEISYPYVFELKG